MSDSEVPLDLRRQMENVDDESTGYGDVVQFVDTQPDDTPDTCPDCGSGLTTTSVYVDGDGDAVAVCLTCTGTHGDGLVASYVYEPATGELYLDREQQPKRVGTE